MALVTYFISLGQVLPLVGTAQTSCQNSCMLWQRTWGDMVGCHGRVCHGRGGTVEGAWLSQINSQALIFSILFFIHLSHFFCRWPMVRGCNGRESWMGFK